MDTLLPDIDDTQPVKEYDERGHLIVKLSPRATCTIRELTGLESIKADRLIGSGSEATVLTMKVYGLFAMQSLTIDGQARTLPPATNNINVDLRAQELTASELIQLFAAYVSEYMLGATQGDDALKN